MIAKLNFYDNQQFTGEPEISCEASAFLYDDNLTFQENCQAILVYEGRQNIKPQLDFAPSSSDPAFYKRSYCKELYYRVGVVLARMGLIWRQWDTSGVQDFPGNKLYAVGVSTSSNIGTPIFVKTDYGYMFNLINGYTGSQGYETNASTLMTWLNENPEGIMEAYFKILYSYNEDNETYIRGVIVGFKGYVFGTTNDVVRVELSTQFTGQTIIDLEDEPGDEDMKIITPNLTELFNRQYICKRGHAYALGNYVSNFPSQGSLLEKINAMLGGFAEWLSTIVDLTIFPFDVSSKVAHSSGITTIRFSPADLQDSFQNLTFSEVLYPITVRDCLFDGCSWTLISRTYNDFRDYPPYRKSQLYIPYIGIVDLDLTAYYGKYIKIKYAVDISCGGCRAYVCIANSSSVSDDGLIVAQFDGTMGVHCPITDVLWSEHYNSINNALGGAVTGGITSAIEGKPTGALNLPMTAVSAGYELNKAESRVPAQSSGSASSCLNSYTDTSCYMFWYDVDTDETTYLNQLKGYSSNKSGLLSGFTGYLECSDVRLVCGKATESEKTRLVQLLTSGIYI